MNSLDSRVEVVRVLSTEEEHRVDTADLRCSEGRGSCLGQTAITNLVLARIVKRRSVS